jgi:signal transduction histidine kinase
MREQLYNLYPTALAEKGLAGVLEDCCNELKTRHLISVTLTVTSEPELSMFQKEALYYIARETLWNVIRHSNAKSVTVSLAEENNHVILFIEDDGGGFDMSLISSQETFGLKSMRERARHIGGTLELDSRPGEGTRIVVRVPARLQETM